MKPPLTRPFAALRTILWPLRAADEGPRHLRSFAIALAIALLPAAPAWASMPVPVDVQTELFVNIGKHDRNFDPRRGIVLGIVYQDDFPESVAAKNAVIEAAKSRSLPVTCVPLEVGSQQLLRKRLTETNANIVYVAPLRAVDVGDIGRITRQRDIRSVTGIPEYVDLGIAVGIGLRNRRPLIIINLEAARAEGAAFSSQLLSLARIVGPLR